MNAALNQELRQKIKQGKSENIATKKDEVKYLLTNGVLALKV